MKKILLLLIIVLTCSCTSNYEYITDENENTELSENTTIYSEDNIFSTIVPSSFKQSNKKLNTTSNIECYDKENNMYFMAIMENKNESNITLETFNDLVVNANSENYETTLSERELTTSNKYTMYLNKFNFINNNDTYIIYLYSIETDNYFGQLFTWTSVENEEENMNILREIVDNFEENEIINE
jgi:hypothetical protein